jgi:hypothetical protein
MLTEGEIDVVDQLMKVGFYLFIKTKVAVPDPL